MKTYELINKKLKELEKSTFRSSFKLKEKDKNYLKEKGSKIIIEHTYNFIKERLAKEIIENDGKQTPTKGHPVFIAQHATATCCRGCLEKWHHIKKNKELSNNEINYIATIIISWLEKELQ